MEIKKVEINKLKPAKYNPRKDLKPGDAEFEHIKNSIEKFGYIDPIIYNVRNNVIVGGHQRYKVLKKLGYTEIDAVEVDMDEQTEKAANAALNKAQGDWDLEKLDLLLADITEIDMSDFGFNLDLTDDKEKEKEVEQDEIPEPEEETRTKPGDVWKLGNHKLMCGDSTSATDLDKLMNGEKADLVFTDPPYGMKKEKDGVANDNLNYDDLLEFNRQWIPLTFAFTKDNGSWYCWGIDEPLMDIYSNILKPMIKQNKITFRNLITWDKGNGQGQMAEDFRMYAPADEKCLFVMCGVQGADGVLDSKETLEGYFNYMAQEINKAGFTNKTLNNITGYQSIASHWTLNADGTQKQPRLIQKDDYIKIQNYCVLNKINAFKREYDDLKREWYSTRAYFNNTHDNMNNVWHFDRTAGKEKDEAGGHATPKPLALCARAIKSSSREGELVLDVFGGSGSTLIACEQLGRRANLMELEPKWCDVIIRRWETLTGKKAELIR